MLMKKLFKFNKEKVMFKVATAVFAGVLCISANSFAVEFSAQLSDEYLKWYNSEDRDAEDMPRAYNIEAPEFVLNEYSKNKVSDLSDMLFGNRSQNLLKINSDLVIGEEEEEEEEPTEDPKDDEENPKDEEDPKDDEENPIAEEEPKDDEENPKDEEDPKEDEEIKKPEITGKYTDSRYCLADDIDIRIKNQMSTNQCWAFSVISSLESNELMKTGKTNDYSERHMDYSTSKSFTDGVNPLAFNRNTGDGGLPGMGLAYLTNGQGAVLESAVPFEDNEKPISIKTLDQEVVRIVTDYEILPSIYKSKRADGGIEYSDGVSTIYSEEELKNLRYYIKQAIIDHGAVVSVTAGGYADYYNNTSNPFLATAYHCDNEYITRDHAITIVGWDDNYSRENFNAAHRPTSDGAYIVLNSYGEESFGKGYLYISYEDVLIESDLCVIQGSKEKDYDHIYQDDEFGGMFAVGSSSIDTGYYGKAFERDDSIRESLKSIGVTVEDYVSLEIYVNPKNSSMTEGSLKRVGGTDGYIEPGYHEIDINDIELTGKEYSIVIKQYSKTKKFHVTIETSCAGTVYSNVKTSDSSFISTDGREWMKLNDMSIAGLEMQNADVCIKGFTKVIKHEDKFASEVYKIDYNKIYQIDYNTTKENFLKQIESTYEMTILNEEGKDVTDSKSEPIIRSGMKLKLDNGNEYELVVRGDLNSDGLISITDLSKIILEYNEVTGFRLSGVSLDSADMNFDGRITLTDVSQLLVIYSKIM